MTTQRLLAITLGVLVWFASIFAVPRGGGLGRVAALGPEWGGGAFNAR